jgi:tRNA A-37 threonylcarbamoyl transferase component Bud32
MLSDVIQGQHSTARSEHDHRIEQLVRASAGTGYRVLGGPIWLTVLPDRTAPLEHGWKLHISSRASTFPALMAAALPVLIAEGCAFKLARSQRVLDEINDGVTSPATVGKAVTVYPDQDRVCELATRLASVLAGYQGPRVLSDRRVSPSAPVYYRYGPFVGQPEANALGELTDWLHGPDGQRFEAVATLRYERPPWVADPFTGERGAPSSPAQPLLGGRYLVTAGIRESARGNVYRARDQRDGATVIVKQARALVSEDTDSVDTRLRLRNERRVYQVLKSLSGVPRVTDHFRHGDDEFLVTSDCGRRTLIEDVLANGPYLVNPGRSGRGLARLAGQLARIVHDVHQRGVIARDLTPGNIVLHGDRVSLVDFGLAGYDGLHLAGGTPGYAPARQLADEPPLDTDDLYALGMTLLFAATKLHPVTLGDDPGLPLLRARQAIRAAHGPDPAGLIGTVVDLLAGGDTARRALVRLLSGRPGRRRGTGTALPAAVTVTGDLVAEITASVRAGLLRETGEILASTADTHAAHDASVYTGTAGIGLELLHHTGAGEVRDILGDLAAFTAATAGRVGLREGLYTGITGVDIFLQRARDEGVPAPSGYGGPGLPPRGFQPAGDDLITGAAGVGLGHLLLFRASGDKRHLEVARRCASTLTDPAEPRSSYGRNPRPENAVEPSAGRAHGLAGVTELLVSVAEVTDEPELLEAARLRSHRLAGRAGVLVRLAGRTDASPLAASWCQGLTGIGQTLLHAGAVLRNPDLTRRARQSADACVALLPRFGSLGQCCGAAGLGGFLLDVAEAEADERYLDAARQAAGHLLQRSAGWPKRPVFTEATPESFGVSWATGLSGLLTFFRRLADGGPDPLAFGQPG